MKLLTLGFAKNQKRQNLMEIGKKSQNDQKTTNDQIENLATRWLWKRPIWSQTTKNGNTAVKLLSKKIYVFLGFSDAFLFQPLIKVTYLSISWFVCLKMALRIDNLNITICFVLYNKFDLCMELKKLFFYF